MASCSTNNKIRLSKNAVLIEEWTIEVSEVHLRRYSEIYSFYDNGQFVFKKKNFSNLPDVSKTGTYCYQPETDMFFLKFSNTENISNYCIQSVKKEYGQPYEMTVKYYKWKIDDLGRYYTEDEFRVSGWREEFLDRKIISMVGS